MYKLGLYIRVEVDDIKSDFTIPPNNFKYTHEVNLPLRATRFELIPYASKAYALPFTLCPLKLNFLTRIKNKDNSNHTSTYT